MLGAVALNEVELYILVAKFYLNCYLNLKLTQRNMDEFIAGVGKPTGNNNLGQNSNTRAVT